MSSAKASDSTAAPRQDRVFLSPAEFARETGLSMPTVRRYLKDGRLVLTLVNTHAADPVEVDVSTPGVTVAWEALRRLAADDIHAHNDFDAPDRVAPQKLRPPTGRLELPPASISLLTGHLAN